ncbi:hypothetical protein BDV12DRAFT_186644 [Aspergillus spectabilis]
MSGFLSRLEVATRWFPPGMPQEERKLVRKLDMLYLDVSALTNAYVSGMKEDLGPSGNRLNSINAAFEVGYVVFQIPSNLVLIKYPAQYYLPFAEIFWGLLTLGTAFVQTYEQLVVLRFFVGLSATSCYVGLVHVVNSWYRKQELGRRNALFWIANPIGQMIAGYLQAAAYTHLNNNHGLRGWRWLFIICTIITIPVAFLYRSTGLSKTLFKRVLGSWRAYAFVILLIIFCQMTYCEGTPFILWLDSQHEKYSVSLVNNMGTITNAAATAGALIMCFYSDIHGSRIEPIIFSGVLCVFANLVLSIWNIPDGLRFFAYISVGWSYGTNPVLITWTAEGLAGDLEVRAIALTSYNTFAEIAGLVVPLVAWPVSKAPGFRGGLYGFCYLLNVALIIFRQRRAAKKAVITGEQGSIGVEDTDSDGVVVEKQTPKV